MYLPKDPVMLLSVINTKLRDYYSSLDALCDDMQAEKQEIIDTLKKIDYRYDSGSNQFERDYGKKHKCHKRCEWESDCSNK